MPQKTAKTKKKNLLPTPTAPKPWPIDIPLRVLNLLETKPWRNVTSFEGVTKTWRSPSRKCSPNGKSRLAQLVEINGKEKNIRLHTLQLSFREKHPYYPYLQGLGQTAVMVLTGSCSPAFAFYRNGRWGCDDRECILENCTVKEPYAPGIKMRFSNGIGFQGKFYGLSLQGTVVVIEDVDSRFRITRIGGNRAVPRQLYRHFREYLVESEGDILLVFLMSRKSIGFVDDVEVFKLDISRLLWVELGNIGDRALLIENAFCMGIIANEVGCVKNCVYFSHERRDEWWVFDLENGKIAPAFGSNANVKERGTWARTG